MLHRPGVLFPRTWIATSNLKRDVSIKINEIDFKIWLRMQSLLCYLQSWKLYPSLAASKWPTLYPIIQNILLAHMFIHLECFFNITSNWTNISMPTYFCLCKHPNSCEAFGTYLFKPFQALTLKPSSLLTCSIICGFTGI